MNDNDSLDGSEESSNISQRPKRIRKQPKIYRNSEFDSNKKSKIEKDEEIDEVISKMSIELNEKSSKKSDSEGISSKNKNKINETNSEPNNSSPKPKPKPERIITFKDFHGNKFIGTNPSNITDLPTSYKASVSMVACGFRHNCLLSADPSGSVYCWGLNNQGQSDVPNSVRRNSQYRDILAVGR